MKVTAIVVSAIFNNLFYFDVSQANYSLKCPERSHWKIRAYKKCKGDADKYHCLYDPNSENITEFCASPKDYTAGFMAVYRGNIDADLCPGYRYMPSNFKSNMTESCIFLKSTCNGEGQFVHQNWSLAEDATCMCDFSNGYAFIQKPKSNCFCRPSMEDCSCYKKPCNNSNYILSPDYNCIVSKLEKTQTSDSNKYQCHPYQDRIMPETNYKMISVLPCLSDVSSTYFKKVSCSDRSQYVDIIVITTTLIITALGLRYLNEDEEKKHIDTSDTMCQTLGVDHENSTERQRKTDGYSNEDEEKKQIDTSDAMCQTLRVDHENSTERQRKTDDNSVVVDDYFIINCKHSILQFYEGVKLQKDFKTKPRILDMCFVKINNGIHLVYIDADNMMMVVRDLSNTSNLRKRKLDHVPNRLSKIDDSTVAVIYKKELHVLIFDVVNMKHKASYSITPGDIKKLQKPVHWNLADTHHMKSESRIEGIVALSPTKLILSDKSRLYSCNLDENNKTINVSEFACSLDPFDTARRLTHVTVSQDSCQEVIFIADENDKQLTSISQNENFISNHTKPNRGLQNVRAIGATENRVYAATSAGISVFCHEEGVFTEFENQDNDMTDYKMMLEYEKHVEHTRGLCLHLDEQYIYIGLSCVIKQNDVILIFKFKPDGIFK